MKLQNYLVMLGQRCAKLVAILLLTLVTSFQAVFASDLNWDFKFNSSDFTLTPNREYTIISLADGSDTRDAIGAPAIPAKFVNILLPDGATNVSVTATGALELLASDVTPWPVQRLAPKSKVQPPFTQPDPAAYASASPWPMAAATFEGLHEMQGSTFVSVRVNPLVYVGSEKALYYRPNVTVSVSYTAPSAPRGSKGMRNSMVSDMANALVVNPAAPSSAPRSNKRDANTVDYLIITSSSLSSAFQNLATYRSSAIGGGYSTLVVTKESISSNYSGDDVQMKIRNCISDYVSNHGTTYVVLGGDDTVVPDRDTYCYAQETEEKRMPTDLYYSDLTGTWKASGNSNFGVKAADVDMAPDVIVGRIPVRTAAQFNAYLAKVKAFEADLTYTRNSIILGGPAAWCRYYSNKRPSDDVTGDGHVGFRASTHGYVSDSEMWLRRLYRDGIKPYWDNAENSASRTVNLACDAITSWDTSTSGDKALSANNLKNWLNNGYTHLMFSGHGYPQGWGMETSADYSTTQAAAQTNLIAFVYTDACLTGAFDQDGYSGTGTITPDYGTSDQYTYTSEPCLGEAFIRNANGGSLVHMGCARYGWGTPDYLDSDPDDTDSDGYYTQCTASNYSDGGPSTVYAYKFYKRLYESDAINENRTLGKAFAMSKADMISQCSEYDCERWIQFGLNFLGDPAIALYPRSALSAPQDLAVSDVTPVSFKASWTAVEGADAYQVDVIKGTSFESSNGAPVLKADFSSTSGWTLSGTGTYTGSGYYGNATPAIKFDGTGDYAISPDFGSGVKLQFWALGNNGSGSTFKISGLVSGTWTVITTVSIAQGGNTYEVELPSGTSQLRFDFTKSVNCALDDVVVFGPVVEAGEYVTGWQNTTVNATSANITGLMPNTAYSIRVRAINSDDTSKWSDVVSVTTVAGNSAPVWSAFPEETYNIYVGEGFELITGSYVSGAPTPTLSMVSSDSDDATFDATNGRFLFTPSATGIYNFTFRATNALGSADASIVVNVANPPVTVPTLAVSETDITSATAPVSWTPCDGVTEYTLQLATDNLFTVGNPGTSVTILENAASSNTAPAGWTYNISTDKSKSYLVLFKGHNVITEAFDASNFDDLTLSFYMRTYGGTGNPSVTISYSTDNGNTWTEIPGTLSATNTTMSQRTLDISAAAGYSSVQIRISSTSTSTSVGVGIKDIVISGTKVVGSSIVSTTTVNGTDYTFTDLEPGTTYFVRVKGEAEWSNVESFTTNNVLMLANGSSNTDAISTAATNGGRYDVTLQGRTLYKDNSWNTLCLPFALNEAQIASSPLAGADIRTLNNVIQSDKTVIMNFTEEGTLGAIEAGKPYIIKWAASSDNIVSPVFRGVVLDGTMNDIACDVVGSTSNASIIFKGTYDNIAYTSENASVLFVGAENKFYYPLAGASIGAMRAYFDLDGFNMSSNGVKQFIMTFAEEDPTGISDMNGMKESDDSWYDLEGRKLYGVPVKKGLYIHGGRKVLWK